MVILFVFILVCSGTNALNIFNKFNDHSLNTASRIYYGNRAHDVPSCATTLRCSKEQMPVINLERLPPRIDDAIQLSSSNFDNIISCRLDSNPALVQGSLENGLRYYILPDSHPAGQFETHLEILSGSLQELDHQVRNQ